MGAGGLGCPAGLYLAAAGIGQIGLVDYDAVEISNLHRQIAHTEDRNGVSKVTSLATSLRNINSTITIKEYHTLLTRENALEILGGYDVIIDATDNVVTRYLLSDACVLLDKPLVSGAALRWDGQLTTYHFNNGPCYRCIHPIPPPAEAVTNCDMGGVLGPIPGMIGTLQALEVIRLIALQRPNYSQKMLLFDGDTGMTRVVSLRGRREDCAMCGVNPSITRLQEYTVFCNSRADDKGGSLDLLESEERISVHELEVALLNPNMVLLDVRNRIHSEIYSLPSALSNPLYSNLNCFVLEIPLEELERRIDEIPEQNDIICICRRGNDSQRAVTMLKAHGIHSKDVIGGLHEYSRKIDPNIPIY